MAKKITKAVPVVEPATKKMDVLPPAENLAVEIKDGQMIITSDATKRLHLSKSGRSQIIGSTNGLSHVTIDGQTYFIAVSIAVPNVVGGK